MNILQDGAYNRGFPEGLYERKIMKLKPLLLNFLLVFGTVFTTQACAEDNLLPAFYSVTRVSADDVLNVREEPSASSPIIFSFEPNSRNIEVVSLSDGGKWGLVSIPEAHGWISMHYLDRQLGQSNTNLPRPMVCFGSEPSWFLKLGDQHSEFSQIYGNTMLLENKWEDTAVGMGSYIYGVLLQGEETQIHASIERSVCSDGMSDSLYGLTINAFHSDISGTQLYRGCCSLR